MTTVTQAGVIASAKQHNSASLFDPLPQDNIHVDQQHDSDASQHWVIHRFPLPFSVTGGVAAPVYREGKGLPHSHGLLRVLARSTYARNRLRIAFSRAVRAGLQSFSFGDCPAFKRSKAKTPGGKQVHPGVLCERASIDLQGSIAILNEFRSDCKGVVPQTNECVTS